MGARVSTGADSKQDYATPPELIRAVEHLLGPVVFDLAASASNTKHPRYLSAPGSNDPRSIGEDALSWHWQTPWNEYRVQDGPSIMWLNPPFADIGPWAKKCAKEGKAGASIAFLTPASVGANWFRDHVVRHADVYFLNGRVSFSGGPLYPKDCMLSHFHPRAEGRVAIWNWRARLIEHGWPGPTKP